MIDAGQLTILQEEASHTQAVAHFARVNVGPQVIVFLESDEKEASLKSMMKANSRSKQSALRVYFNG